MECAGKSVLYAEENEWSAPLIRPELWLLLLPPPFASIWAFLAPKKTDTQVKELHLSSSSLTSSFLVLASSLFLHSIQRTRPLRNHPTESSLSLCFILHSSSISILFCYFTWEEISCSWRQCSCWRSCLLVSNLSYEISLDLIFLLKVRLGFWIQTHSLSFHFGAVLRGVWASRHGLRRTRPQHPPVSSSGPASGEWELPSAC